MSLDGPRLVGVDVRPGPTSRGGGEGYMGDAPAPGIPSFPVGGDSGLRGLRPGLDGVDKEDPP